TRRARAPDGLEEVLEPGRRDDPQHHEIVPAVVDELVLHVVAEHARGARYERMRGAVDHDVARAAEADLQLDLIAMGVLAHTPSGRDGLIAHRERAEPRARGKERGIGVTVGGHGLPVRRPLARLDDDGATADLFVVAHDLDSTACAEDALE